MTDDFYVPAAVATVVSSGGFDPCPGCGREEGQRYSMMGGREPMRCGRCFDDWAFAGKPELRAEMEAKRDEVLAFARPFVAGAAAALAAVCSEDGQ